MFKFLQHLFTVRAIETELNEAKKSISDLQAEIVKKDSEIIQLKDNVSKLTAQVNRPRNNEPQFADSNYDPFA